MLYIEIVDFSAEKALARPLCNRGLSNGEIIVIIVITDIAVVSPFFVDSYFKEKRHEKVFWNSLGFNLIKAHEVLAKAHEVLA